MSHFWSDSSIATILLQHIKKKKIPLGAVQWNRFGNNCFHLSLFPLLEKLKVPYGFFSASGSPQPPPSAVKYQERNNNTTTQTCVTKKVNQLFWREPKIHMQKCTCASALLFLHKTITVVHPRVFWLHEPQEAYFYNYRFTCPDVMHFPPKPDLFLYNQTA